MRLPQFPADSRSLAESGARLQSTDYYRLTVVSNPALSPTRAGSRRRHDRSSRTRTGAHNEIWMAPGRRAAPAFRYTSPSTEASSRKLVADGSLLAFSSKREGRTNDICSCGRPAPGGEAFQIKGVHAMPVFSRTAKAGVRLARRGAGQSEEGAVAKPRLTDCITRGPDPKRFDAAFYTSIPIVADERGYLPPRETAGRATSTS